MPREYQNASGQIVLDYAKAIQESVFEQLRVVHEGQLRVVFSPDLKMKPVDSARRMSKTNGSATPILEFNEFCTLNVAPIDSGALNMASTVAATRNLSPIDCVASKMASTVATTMNLKTDDSVAPNSKPIDSAKLKNMEPNDFLYLK